ncbi:LA_2272 family surface repeat-containing protein [Gracilinema caldarium]|uniref:DUF5723 domain-containing protein n=1 Tax=Gracilinema caldarium (strain ATCC 51460 / DSM 7334 / H1) TaxID=744872 RepID=F8F347_GRAC1|nr:hypothetical protein [Gracilinema caldarium]AEJ20373.1 hypothetical protein Spica_2259 [Gracilinema caldarium DSM 7334]
MKRIVGSLVALLMGFSFFAGPLAAQEDDETVLQKAREQYQEKLNRERDTNRADAEFPSQVREATESYEDSEVPYTPVLLSFAPGVSSPFGYYRTSASFALIGATFEASYGFAGAGVFNIYNQGFGFQGAGVFNIAGGPVRGAQLAGVFNIAEDVTGSVQAAGVFNIAKTVKGIQIAEVFNVAESVDGMQIGLVNITDELRGLQIGLINISRNGVDSLSFVYMPATDTAFAYWQAGSPFIYLVLGAGAPRTDWFVRNDNLMVSAGLGTRVRLGGPYIDIDVSAEQHLGKDIEALYQAGVDCDKDAFISLIKPYPTARLSLGLPLSRSLHLTGGIKTLVQLEEGGTVPEFMKTQDTLSATWFGIPFTAWSQWFVGAKVTL